MKVAKLTKEAYMKVKKYIESCKWFKYCKTAYGMVISFIKKQINRIKGVGTRDLVEVEGVWINVPSKSLAEAYQEVMKEFERMCEC